MSGTKLTVCAVLCLCFSPHVHADWPGFRGPNGSAISKDSLPVSWTPEKNIAWKKEIPGAGVSSPIVVGNRVFVTCYSGYGLDRSNPGEIEDLQRHLVCYDAATGEKIWQKDVEVDLPEDPYTGIGVTAHGYASHTPVSDGERVYVFFGKSGALAFDMDGNQLWQTKLGEESDPWKWGSASSPVVHENLLIVVASAESQAIVGLDKKTGEEVWRQEASGLDGMWGTPSLVEIDADRTDLVMSVAKEIWGLDPTTGKLRWFSEATGAEQAQSSLVTGGKTVYAFTGRGGGSVAVRAGGNGDVTDEGVVWSNNVTARFASPVGFKSNIYLIAGGVLKAIDPKTGDTTKQVRLQGGGSSRGRFGSLDYPSPVVAGDKLYYLNGSGHTFVFSTDGEVKQLSVNLVTTESESFGGTPAISNDRMYLRSNKHLYCIADSGEEVEPNASKPFMAKPDPEAENAGGRRGGRREGGFRGRPGGGRGGFGGGRGGGRGRGGRGRGGDENDDRPKRPQRPELAD